MTRFKMSLSDNEDDSFNFRLSTWLDMLFIKATYILRWPINCHQSLVLITETNLLPSLLPLFLFLSSFPLWLTCRENLPFLPTSSFRYSFSFLPKLCILFIVFSSVPSFPFSLLFLWSFRYHSRLLLISLLSSLPTFTFCSSYFPTFPS